VYSCRTTPADYHGTQLQHFDSLVRQTFAGFTGLHLNDNQWSQATRGFDQAGLGLRSASRHAPAAYLASCSATADLCTSVDPSFQWTGSAPGSHTGRALGALNAALPADKQLVLDSLTSTALLKQSALSSLLDDAQHTAHKATLSTAELANLESECRRGAAGFLSAIPSTTLDLTFEPAEFIVEIRTRLVSTSALLATASSTAKATMQEASV
jgi:hypothetical protein